MSEYDVIVVGGGSPGEHCAGAVADGGVRVALVERELVGGLYPVQDAVAPLGGGARGAASAGWCKT